MGDAFRNKELTFFQFCRIFVAFKFHFKAQKSVYSFGLFELIRGSLLLYGGIVSAAAAAASRGAQTPQISASAITGFLLQTY